MRKFIITAMAAAVVSAGCQTEPATPTAGGGITTITATTPGQQTRMAIDFDTPDTPDTDELVWAAGDQVTMFELNQDYVFTGNTAVFTLTAGAGTRSATFSGGPVSDGGIYLAIAGKGDNVLALPGELEANVKVGGVASGTGSELFLSAFFDPAGGTSVDFSANGNLFSVIEIPLFFLPGTEVYNVKGARITADNPGTFARAVSVDFTGAFVQYFGFTNTAGVDFASSTPVDQTVVRIPMIWNPEVTETMLTVSLITDDGRVWQSANPITAPLMQQGKTMFRQEPLEVSEPNGVAEYTPAPGTLAPVADLLDVAFNTAGAADLSGSFAIGAGEIIPATTYNSALRTYEAAFSGGGNTQRFFYAQYRDNEAFKAAIGNGFTMEVMYCPASIPSGFTDVVGAMESGGFGLELSGTKPEMWLHTTGPSNGYKQIGEGNVAAGQWYHAVYTWDQAAGEAKAYMNGVLTETVTVTGNLNFPSNGVAHYYCIGGDSNTNVPLVSQASFDGTIAFTRLYDKPVSRDEAFMLYKQVNDRRALAWVDNLNTAIIDRLPVMLESADEGDKPAIQALLDEGWALMGNLATTDGDIRTYLNKVALHQ